MVWPTLGLRTAEEQNDRNSLSEIGRLSFKRVSLYCGAYTALFHHKMIAKKQNRNKTQLNLTKQFTVFAVRFLQVHNTLYTV